MDDKMLIYGSYGYTGNLIVRLALANGHMPVLAGRSEAKLRPQAEELGLEWRVFSLDDASAAARGLEGVRAVIHCAGPFAHTAKDMANACMAARAHYLDITGEIKVFEQMHHLGEKAKAAGIVLLPGAGFDVVPSDCLAAHLKELLPSATELKLAFMGIGRTSHGTATTMAENLGEGGCIREQGKLTRVPHAYRERDVEFLGGIRKTCITIPWGDVSTAYYSTGIPNIEVYMAAPKSLRRSAKLARYVAPLLGTGPVQKLLKSRIAEGGPSDDERAKGYSLLWGEVTDSQGSRREARLRTPEGYTLTAATALRAAEVIMTGDVSPGFQTPSLAFGADFIMEFEGVERA